MSGTRQNIVIKATGRKLKTSSNFIIETEILKASSLKTGLFLHYCKDVGSIFQNESNRDSMVRFYAISNVEISIHRKSIHIFN